MIARELGGGRFAQGLAAFCVLTSPLFLRSSNLLQPVVLDQLIWTALLYTFVRLCRGHGPGEWILLGVLTGLGLLTKFTIAFIALGILVAVLLTPLREARFTWWPWMGLAVALALGAPSLVGQIRLGFPVLGQMADLRASQLERIGPFDFLLGQLLWGPAVLLAGAGLVGLFMDAALRPFRPVGLEHRRGLRPPDAESGQGVLRRPAVPDAVCGRRGDVRSCGPRPRGRDPAGPPPSRCSSPSSWSSFRWACRCSRRWRWRRTPARWA